MYVDIQEANERFIDAYIRVTPDDPLVHVTFVYGEPRTENRHRFWSQLMTLRASSPLPWVLLGDFNEALWQYEHFSVHPRAESQMIAFRDCLQVCELKDLGFSGLPYTYDNRRAGSHNVRVRLDRAVADDGWRDIYSAASVIHVVSPCSDHDLVLLSLDKEIHEPPVKRCMQYEIFWEREPALKEVIDREWRCLGHLPDLGAVNNGLGTLMHKLHAWGREKFGNVTRELARLREQLQQLHANNAPREDIRAATDLMNEVLYREEMLWLQRSRIEWLKEGDRNTKFFHHRAVWRARKNKISKLRDENGVEQTVPTEMQRMAVSYFKSLYTRDPSLNGEAITNLTPAQITDAMNEQLCREFSDEEIADALFQIGPIKAPGPDGDGFPARFYQRNWDLLRGEVIPAVKQFFATGFMPEGVNDTSIVLIPKIDNPMELKDFRPIGLCNVLYKVVSKCLVNRLRPLLGDVISENQSAFVPGRMITDNALLAFECLHYMEHGITINSSFCTYKLDLSKAYDRVDWPFLESTMYKMGFSHRWVQWIMSCVTTVKYSVKFNGNLLEAFSPT